MIEFCDCYSDARLIVLNLIEDLTRILTLFFNTNTGILIVLTALLAVSSAQNSRQNPTKQGANITCGTEDDLALRVQICAKPLMDILEGTIEKWPRNEQDAGDLCNSVSFFNPAESFDCGCNSLTALYFSQKFANAEKCIRKESRLCATGLHKTILSSKLYESIYERSVSSTNNSND